VLEDAPTFNVLATRAESAAASAKVQADVVARFPGVSAIDLSLVAATIKGIIDKATTAVRLLSIFTVGTGLLVLVAAVFTGRYERVQEGVLLRTLGASRRQIYRILIVEYLCLGTLAAFTGILLAAAGNWALAQFVFKLPWIPAPGAMATAWALVSALTIGIGLLASRGVCDSPPLEILRAEE
jgi:putative ABC transport system permease protein